MADKEDWFESDDNENLGEQARSIDLEHNSIVDQNGKRILLGYSTRTLPQLVRFVKRVHRTKKVPFKIIVDTHGRKRAVEDSALASSFYSMNGMTQLYSRDYHYAPALQLFFDTFAFHDIRSCELKAPNARMPDGRLEAEAFNDFVKVQREEGTSMNIVKRMNDWQNATDDNATRLKAYMEALFERYARLIVIRLDLNYRVASIDPGSVDMLKEQLDLRQLADYRCLYGDQAAEHDALETQARFDVKVLNEDRKRLFANKRGKPTLFEHLVGYVWRIEWSRVSGYHMHTAFFFDGSKVQKDAWLADQIGRYWSDAITKGRGIYHNCNGNPAVYADRYGIGEVNHYDVSKRENLMRALLYLAKRNQYLYVKPTKKCNLFGTGHLPGEKPAAGRPRKKGKSDAE